jgi:hypothetical protein
MAGIGGTTAFQRDAGSAPINTFRSAAVFTAFMCWPRSTWSAHFAMPCGATSCRPAGWSNVLLILNDDRMPQLQAAAPDLAFEILERFPNAVARPDENYVVYRVRLR